jgi:hypothetical protein
MMEAIPRVSILNGESNLEEENDQPRASYYQSDVNAVKNDVESQGEGEGNGFTWEDCELPASSALAIVKFTPIYEYQQLELRSHHHRQAQIKIRFFKPQIFALLCVFNETWWLLCVGDLAGWVEASPDLIDKGVLRKTSEFRRYESWNGRNTFCCNGKVILGGDHQLFG